MYLNPPGKFHRTLSEEYIDHDDGEDVEGGDWGSY